MTEPLRSADILVNHLLNTPGLLDQVKLNPEDTLRKLAKEVTYCSACPRHSLRRGNGWGHLP